MSNCLARSAILSSKREGCDQLGQGYFSSLIKLEWSSGMGSPRDVVRDSSPFQLHYVGDSRRALNQHQQHYYPRQENQGGTYVSANGLMKESISGSTESSVVFNSWGNFDGGGSLPENRRPNQMRTFEEQWWVDILASGSIVIPSTLFQQENITLNALVDCGVPGQQVEDLQSIVLTQPEDPDIVKISGDRQIDGLDDTGPAQNTEDMDSLMFDQEFPSSNQQQLGQFLGDDFLNRHGLHDLYYRDTFSTRLSLSNFHPPAASDLNSTPKFFHEYSSLPRPFSHTAPLHDNPSDLTNCNGVSAFTVATPSLNIDERVGPSFSAPASVFGATRFSSDTFSTAEYCAQFLLFGNSISEAQIPYGNTHIVHESNLAADEGSGIIRGGISSLPLSVHSFCPNFSSYTPVYYREDKDKLLDQNFLQPTFSSLAIADPPAQQFLSSPAMSGDYPISPQPSWNIEKMSLQAHHSCSENWRSRDNRGWKRETLEDCVGRVFSPLPAASSFSLRSPKDMGGSSCDIGDDWNHDDAKLDTGQTEGRVIPEGGLAVVNLLLRAAEAVDIGNLEVAKVILARLNQHISLHKEKSIYRVAHYFCEALVTRIIGVEYCTAQFPQDRTLSLLEEFHKINAYVRFCEVSPYPKFAHFTANQAILEVLKGEEAIHVIDFQMGAGAQWSSFLQDIAGLRDAGKQVPTIRLTAIGTRADEIHVTGANLCNFARMLCIPLDFQAVVTRPECLDVSMLRLRDNEAVAGNFIFSLHELLDGETSDGLSAVLKSVFDARPRIVTTVEQDANHSSTSFQQRFSEALQYYVFLFDSLTSSLEAGADSSANSGIESYLFAPEIMNIVACDGISRVKRHERFEQWRERMLAAGFSSRPLSDASLLQAEKLVAQISARHGFQVTRDQGGLLLGWQGRPLLAASSWIC